MAHGEVSERFIEPVSKTGVRLWRTAGSNPALSVTSVTRNGRERHNCLCCVGSRRVWRCPDLSGPTNPWPEGESCPLCYIGKASYKCFYLRGF